MASYAPSSASGFPGDLDDDYDVDERDPLVIRPDWSMDVENVDRWLDGIWDDDSTAAAASTHGDGDGGHDWAQRPRSQFWGIRGPEAPGTATLMICARTSLVKGIRLLLFERRADGTHRKKEGKRNKKNKLKTAISRFMIVSCKMRFFHLREPPAIDSDDEEPGYTVMPGGEPEGESDIIHGGAFFRIWWRMLLLKAASYHKMAATQNFGSRDAKKIQRACACTRLKLA